MMHHHYIVPASPAVAVFLDFRGEKILRQRNYDCFDAW
jgi:hypothetical protein